jgi:hypothetical protein
MKNNIEHRPYRLIVAINLVTLSDRRKKGLSNR